MASLSYLLAAVLQDALGRKFLQRELRPLQLALVTGRREGGVVVEVEFIWMLKWRAVAMDGFFLNRDCEEDGTLTADPQHPAVR